MAKQQPWTPQAYPRRMEQGGWSPLLAPLPISSPPHHHLGLLLAFMTACAAIGALIFVWLHFAVNGTLW
jgi:hypothetical protein